MRAARLHRANLAHRRNVDAEDLANRLSEVLQCHAALALAKYRNEITELRRRQKAVIRARTDEALRTVAALKCLAFVHWEGVNPDQSPHGAWPRDCDTSSCAWLYRADRHRAHQLATTMRAPASHASASSSSAAAASSAI